MNLRDINQGSREVVNKRSSILVECRGELVEPVALNETRLRQAQADNFYN
jgi:hypothetical protein